MVEMWAFERSWLIRLLVKIDVDNSFAPTERVIKNMNNVTVKSLHLNQVLISQLLYMGDIWSR